MTELAPVLGFIVFMAWLWMGGYAFFNIQKHVEDSGNSDGLGAVFIFCVLIGPFMAAYTHSYEKQEKLNDQSK